LPNAKIIKTEKFSLHFIFAPPKFFPLKGKRENFSVLYFCWRKKAPPFIPVRFLF